VVAALYLVAGGAGAPQKVSREFFILIFRHQPYCSIRTALFFL